MGFIKSISAFSLLILLAIFCSKDTSPETNGTDSVQELQTSFGTITELLVHLTAKTALIEHARNPDGTNYAAEIRKAGTESSVYAR